MQQQSDLLKMNVKIIFEVNVVDMTKNKLTCKICHTKIRFRHGCNPLQCGYVTGNKNNNHLVSECTN